MKTDPDAPTTDAVPGDTVPGNTVPGDAVPGDAVPGNAEAAEPAASSTRPAEEPAAGAAEPEVEPGPPDAAEPQTGQLAPSATEPAAQPEPAARAPKAQLGGLWPPRTARAKLLLAAVVVVLLALGGGGYWWLADRLPEGVAFRVDGVEVTEQELEEQVQTLGALYGVQAPTEEPRLDQFRRDVAKSTAVAMVIDNAAVERKVQVADRQVSDFLGRYVTQVYGEGPAGRDAFVKDLADKGTSEPRVLAELKRQMTLKELFTQVTADITVSDADVRQAFDTRQAEFGTPERREIHNIVVRTRADADAIVAEVGRGGDFEALARQRSMDGSTKDAGGNLGLIAARDLDQPYADAAFAAPVGGVFGPVRTERRTDAGVEPLFNIGKIVQSQPPAPAQLERVSDGVRRLLIGERADAKWRSFITDEITSADVDYADKYRPADPDALAPPANAAEGALAPAGAAAPGEVEPAPAQPPR